MEKEMELSIAIITYNRPQAVIRAIESCVDCLAISYEFVIWDNNSDPENREIVQEYCNRSKYCINYYYSPKNLGVGGGRNAAWKHSSGKYVYFLDDDAAIYSENYFHKLLQYMEEHPNVGVAYTTIYEPETNKEYDCVYTHVGARGLIEKFAFVGGAHIIRRSAIPGGNLYPRKAMFGGEETYASLLLWNSGYQIHKVDSLCVHHLPASANRCIGKERDRAFIIAAYIMKKLTFPKLVQPIVYVLFRIHLKKNGVQYDQECKKIINTTVVKEDIHRVRYACLFKLLRKFGIIPLI